MSNLANHSIWHVVNIKPNHTMTSQNLMKKDQIQFDGQLLDVRYHENRSGLVLDTVKKAGTDQDYDVDSNRQQQLKDKLSGRF